MKIELEAKQFSSEDASEILAAIYQVYHGPDRTVDGTAQETLLPLLEHYGFLGLVRVLKIVVDSSEMKERVKSELGVLWKEHFGRTPTEDELRKYGPVLSCLREAGPGELLPMILRGKEIQAEASRLTNEKRPELAQKKIESALSSIIPGWWLFWHDYGLCFLRQEGKYQQAIPHYERAIDYNEDDTYVFSCDDLRFCYENLARVDSKWYAAGILYFRGLTERRPQRWIAWRCLAWLMWKSGKTSEAIPIYREAINRQLDHGYYHSCDDLRVCYEQTGRQAEGFEYFLQLADSRPIFWPAWHCLALLAWHHKKDKTLAIEYYRQAIAHNPEGGWYWSWQDMGWCLAELGQLDDAEAVYQHAKAINPKSWHTWNALGNLAERRNRPREAVAPFREALRLNPRSEWSWVGLGNCHQYDTPPRYTLAWLAYQEALKVSPGLEQPKAEIGIIEAAGQPWKEIFGLLTDEATEDDLLSICLKLQIQYWDLGGERLRGRTASLIASCRYDGRTEPLIRAIIEERPDLIPPLVNGPETAPRTLAESTGVVLHHVRIRRRELEAQYKKLTARIEALDTDIGRITEEFRRQPLMEQRVQLDAERTGIVKRLADLERQQAGADPTPGT